MVKWQRKWFRSFAMNSTIKPAQGIKGRLQLPGDKSISHRLAMLGAVAAGQTVIDNFATSQDCQSTLNCLGRLGVEVTTTGQKRVTIRGKGLQGLRASEETLDAENSGSTIRMLSGLLAGQPFTTRISGDTSLQRRPMKRVIIPLTEMGATIEARDGNYPPLSIRGGTLQSIHYSLPVASAQVKSAILLAGLFAEGTTEVIEPSPTRNHTELALRGFGIEVGVSGNRVFLRGGQMLRGIHSRVPGDISSAAFFIVAAAILPGSDLTIESVGLNPGRRSIIDWLKEAGANIVLLDSEIQGGEEVGTLRVKPSEIRGGRIDGAMIPQVIDEIPILAVAATQSRDGIEFRDASELRVKESDRIHSIVTNLRSMGAQVEEYPDGLAVPGNQVLKGTSLPTFGDHRIAMAFSVAALAARGETRIEQAECAAVSFPGFFEVLEQLAVR